MDEAKTIIVPLVESVVCAITELHESGRAHQDIRLENICIDANNGNAVLIDLDRACKASQLDTVNTTRYGDSTMYSHENETWTAEMIDWR